ncbi:hypothetical protein PV327_001625 [Microctonus hyperodae]|uniref:Exonuclease domain-containing protein n=1 Tax=Microctonus hyperodae TaxID=165561 RepID=A0AA39FE78_MICHY|nr:hypothetical protein PV327_001625 [Microctonus hyperodae]
MNDVIYDVSPRPRRPQMPVEITEEFAGVLSQDGIPINSNFDKTLGTIVNIIVSYDMSWSKRGNGRSYDSLNGYGAIIGSAKAMEADAGAELLTRSIILKECDLNVKIAVGDEDSSLMSAVNKSNHVNKIYKLADMNHKCFSYAIAQNEGDSVGLAKNSRCIPHHLFDKHENCGRWCKKASNSNSDSYKQQFIINDEKLYDNLQLIFDSYADNAFKFCISASSQANEAFHHTVSRKFPKNKNYSMSSSGDTRVACAVLVKNEGDSYLTNVKKSLNLDDSTMTSQKIIEKDKVTMVVFDLETSGRSKHSDILQIAAIADKDIFSVYVRPTQHIEESASEVNGLTNIDGELYLHGKKLLTLSIIEALQSFYSFLSRIGGTCILVAHNSTFDTSFLLREVIKYSLENEYHKIIYRFADSLKLLKRKFPQRQIKGMFTLSRLAEDLLEINVCKENFHEAT